MRAISGHPGEFSGISRSSALKAATGYCGQCYDRRCAWASFVRIARILGQVPVLLVSGCQIGRVNPASQRLVRGFTQATENKENETGRLEGFPSSQSSSLTLLSISEAYRGFPDAALRPLTPPSRPSRRPGSRARRRVGRGRRGLRRRRSTRRPRRRRMRRRMHHLQTPERA